MTTHEEAVAHDHEAVDPHEEHHPSDWTYIQVAIFLAIVTALEVSTYFVDFGPFAVPALIAMMIIKFGWVVAYFMHLKYDSRMFRRLFVAGLITAIAVYIAALSMFEYWSEDEGIDRRTGTGESVG